MKIIFWGKGERGYVCLHELIKKKYSINLIVGDKEEKNKNCSVLSLANEYGIKTITPENPNNKMVESYLKSYNADLFILAGYGKILKSNILALPSIMTINLHAGQLPQMRGSSPLNWALIKGHHCFTISIIKVDEGIDTGDIIFESVFPISPTDTIADLHHLVNRNFPVMLLKVLEQISTNTITFRKQLIKDASYYPRRFSDDGFILFDMLTAKQIHNRIRALTEPYPCAFTYYKNRKVILISSEYSDIPFYGEAGTIYKKKDGKLLVCAKDKCLWLKAAKFEDDNQPLFNSIKLYDKLATVTEFILNNLSAIKNN